MVNTTNISDFIRLNDNDLRYLVTHFCLKYNIRPINKVIQDVYCHLILHDILSNFNPNITPKLSTYLYRVIKNFIYGRHKSYDTKCETPAWHNLKRTSADDDLELTIRYNTISIEYHHIISQNQISEDLNSLSFEMRRFEKFIEKRNKFYRLARRKNKNLGSKGYTMLDVFRLFKDGLSNHEIAKIYGVSDMSISNVKKDIKDLARYYGFEWKPRSRKVRRGRRRKMPKMQIKARNR